MSDKSEHIFSTFDKLPPLPRITVPAMAYVPFQNDITVYQEDTALDRGTLFCELYKPFCRGDLSECK